MFCNKIETCRVVENALKRNKEANYEVGGWALFGQAACRGHVPSVCWRAGRYMKSRVLSGIGEQGALIQGICKGAAQCVASWVLVKRASAWCYMVPGLLQLKSTICEASSLGPDAPACTGGCGHTHVSAVGYRDVSPGVLAFYSHVRSLAFHGTGNAPHPQHQGVV